MIPLLFRCLWWTPEPCHHGTARGGITTSLQQTPGQPRWRWHPIGAGRSCIRRCRLVRYRASETRVRVAATASSMCRSRACTGRGVQQSGSRLVGNFLRLKRRNHPPSRYRSKWHTRWSEDRGTVNGCCLAYRSDQHRDLHRQSDPVRRPYVMPGGVDLQRERRSLVLVAVSIS